MPKFSWLILIFFLAYFLLGLFIFRDYGSYWDEPRDRLTGIVALKFVLFKDPELFSYRDRYYGTAFQLPLVALEKWLRIDSPPEIYFLRHFSTFLLFFIAVFIFYLLCKDYFKNFWIGVLGATFLILSPRIFADSFYNSKDLVLLSAFIISSYTMYRFIKSPNILWSTLHAAACAFAVDVRLVGLLIPGFTALFILFDVIVSPAFGGFLKTKVIPLGIFILFFWLFVILFWPFLWRNSLTNFIDAIGFMSKFEAYGGTVLYLGQFIKANQVPWHYIPVWIFFTTPLLYTLLFLVGMLKTLIRLRYHLRATYRKEKILLLSLLWLLIPWVLVINSHNELYDGWRHFYFIYPAFLLIALYGFYAIWELFKNVKFAKVAAVIVILGNFAWVGRFMVINHPYQYLYFNEAIGGMENAKKNFDLDYWGLTFKKGLEFIAQEDQGSAIPYMLEFGSAGNVQILPKKDWERFVFIYDFQKMDQAKYILSNYRWHPQDYQGQNEIYSLKIDKTKVMSVFKAPFK